MILSNLKILNMAFVITALDNTFRNVNEDTIAEGHFSKALIDGVEKLIKVDFDTYVNDNGELGAYVGKTTGHPLQDQTAMRYNLPEGTRRQHNLIWDQIDEIEPHYFTAAQT